MPIDEDAAYRAVASRDARFDGMFYTGVRTTGIYCRPSCSARTPHRRNVGFYPSSAAAQRAGFRACKMCRPDATPGSADWNSRADLAGRAVRLIADGVVDRDGVAGLARALGYSERQLNRALLAALGAPPLALARAQRAQTARILLETTDLAASDVAFAAGFASIRQFNDTIREIFASTPSQLRAGRGAPRGEPGTIDLRLAYRSPMDLGATLRFLAGRAVTGLEAYDGTTLTRTLRLPHGAALVNLTPATDHVAARLRLADHRDLAAAVARIRRLLDLDADPAAVDEALAGQPMLAGLVARRPGLRSPGTGDGFEMAVRAVVGQQVSVAGARTVLARL
ncbi:MAG: AraC family transcriptional regulator, partial [Pseudonocardiales bacterium]|nr:AraC family transcriptional regulator [Pseudonocardiales bacterium]